MSEQTQAQDPVLTYSQSVNVAALTSGLFEAIALLKQMPSLVDALKKAQEELAALKKESSN